MLIVSVLVVVALSQCHGALEHVRTNTMPKPNWKKTGYNYLGCWKDVPSNRAIPTMEGTDSRLDGSYKSRDNALQKCYEVARSKGYKVFALQNGGWCAGSSSAQSTYKKYGWSQSCFDGKGGGGTNDVYIMKGTSRLDTGMPWRKDGRCGKKYPLEISKKWVGKDGKTYFSNDNGQPAQCNPKGNGARKGPCCSDKGWCGNSDAHCKCKGCVNYAPYTSLGCYKDNTRSRAISTLEGKDKRLTGSYKTRSGALDICYEVAKSKGYEAFALQNGGWCAGSSTALDTYDKYGKATNCVNGKGGPGSNTVYKINN